MPIRARLNGPSLNFTWPKRSPAAAARTLGLENQAQRQPSLSLIAQEVEVLPGWSLLPMMRSRPKELIYIGLLPVVIKAIPGTTSSTGAERDYIKSLKAECSLQQRNAELDARLTAVEQALPVAEPAGASTTKPSVSSSSGSQAASTIGRALSWLRTPLC